MRTVHIEICENCKEHKWYAHHSQNKFVNRYQQVKSQLAHYFPSIQIVKNKLPPNFYPIESNPSLFFNADINKLTVFPRIGAFEITFENEVIFSKLQTNAFPEDFVIISRIKNIIGKKGIKEIPKDEKNRSYLSDKDLEHNRSWRTEKSIASNRFKLDNNKTLAPFTNKFYFPKLNLYQTNMNTFYEGNTCTRKNEKSDISKTLKRPQSLNNDKNKIRKNVRPCTPEKTGPFPIFNSNTYRMKRITKPFLIYHNAKDINENDLENLKETPQENNNNIINSIIMESSDLKKSSRSNQQFDKNQFIPDMELKNVNNNEKSFISQKLLEFSIAPSIRSEIEDKNLELSEILDKKIKETSPRILSSKIQELLGENENGFNKKEVQTSKKEMEEKRKSKISAEIQSSSIEFEKFLSKRQPIKTNNFGQTQIKKIESREIQFSQEKFKNYMRELSPAKQNVETQMEKEEKSLLSKEIQCQNEKLDCSIQMSTEKFEDYVKEKRRKVSLHDKEMQSSIKIEKRSIMVQNSITFKNNSTQKETANDFKIMQTSNPKLVNESIQISGSELILIKLEKKNNLTNTEMQTSLEKNITPVIVDNFERSQQTKANSFINSHMQTSFDTMDAKLSKKGSISKKDKEIQNSINFEEKNQQTSNVELIDIEIKKIKNNDKDEAIQLIAENIYFSKQKSLKMQNFEMQTNEICIREIIDLDSKFLQTSERKIEPKPTELKSIQTSFPFHPISNPLVKSSSIEVQTISNSLHSKIIQTSLERKSFIFPKKNSTKEINIQTKTIKEPQKKFKETLIQTSVERKSILLPKKNSLKETNMQTDDFHILKKIYEEVSIQTDAERKSILIPKKNSLEEINMQTEDIQKKPFEEISIHTDSPEHTLSPTLKNHTAMKSIQTSIRSSKEKNSENKEVPNKKIFIRKKGQTEIIVVNTPYKKSFDLCDDLKNRKCSLITTINPARNKLNFKKKKEFSLFANKCSNQHGNYRYNKSSNRESIYSELDDFELNKNKTWKSCDLNYNSVKNVVFRSQKLISSKNLLIVIDENDREKLEEFLKNKNNVEFNRQVVMVSHYCLECFKNGKELLDSENFMNHQEYLIIDLKDLNIIKPQNFNNIVKKGELQDIFYIDDNTIFGKMEIKENPNVNNNKLSNVSQEKNKIPTKYRNSERTNKKRESARKVNLSFDDQNNLKPLIFNQIGEVIPETETAKQLLIEEYDQLLQDLNSN